jgi:hypothetical protein
VDESSCGYERAVGELENGKMEVKGKIKKPSCTTAQPHKTEKE